jgi:hypothetical protein
LLSIHQLTQVNTWPFAAVLLQYTWLQYTWLQYTWLQYTWLLVLHQLAAVPHA